MRVLPKNELIIVILCILWYSVSSSNAIVSKTILTHFPFPMTVSIVQLSSIYVFLKPILMYLKASEKQVTFERRYFWRMILPLALGKFAAALSSHISIWKVPISYSHTVKSTMPLFVIFLSRLINGEKQTTKVYLSIIPIVAGVSIATVTELNFNLVGLTFALLSSFIVSLLNIFSKNVMKERPGLHHLALLSILAKYAFFISIPSWIYMDLFSIFKATTEIPHHLYAYLIIDGFLTFLQNIIAFTILSLVSPLTYSVANSSKRIAIIIVSLITMKNPITFTNMFGMCTAVTGVLLYNRAKHEQNAAKHSLPVYSKMNGSMNGTVNHNGNALLNNSLLLNGHKPITNGTTYVRYY
ncbi:solute carrier family 35 member E1 homolog [Tetranychus urticae]|uniref:Sugar phosphate transporter domain-containing protein n=1 Tax=Tetranychus urticae TaxID=32264 RepID=T1K632_TETUR|nr:solute carrier family 35 member E1 homolog [Tetranychus urticae]